LEGHGHNVLGELYEVDDKMLKNLDILECHPVLYERIRDIVTYETELGTTETAEVWIYFIKKYKPEMAELEYIDEWVNGSCGLVYVASEDDLTDPSDL